MCCAHILLLMITSAVTITIAMSQVTSPSTYGLSLRDSDTGGDNGEAMTSSLKTPQTYNYYDSNEEVTASIVHGHDEAADKRHAEDHWSKSTLRPSLITTHEPDQTRYMSPKDDVNREPTESSTTFIDHDTIPGERGIDFPDYLEIPLTSFQCSNYKQAGYYADPETGCQAFHVCDVDGRHNSFLCPRGTVFNQPYLTCDWWFNVDCSAATQYYGTNTDLHTTATVAKEVSTMS